MSPRMRFLANFIVLLSFVVTASGLKTLISWEWLTEALEIDGEASQSEIRSVFNQTNSSTDYGKALLACQISEILLQPGDCIEPGSQEYVNRTRVNWSNNCWQKATCFVAPHKASEVSKVLRIINATQSRFSIRSGGHDFNVNHSSIDASGFLLDLRYLNRIKLSEDKKFATVGAGAHWGDVYQSLNETGVSINGGRSPNPGVGGQTLGAGVGWLSPIAGVTAASVAAAEVVLPNGTIVRATETSDHSDLLWALRGGGPNFGVVTSFTYRTLPIDKIWFEARTYDADKNEQLIEALSDYQALANEDPNASIIYSLGESTAEPASLVGFAYLQPVERPAVFKPFFDIQFVGYEINSTVGTLADLASRYNTLQYPDIPPERNYVVTLPHRADRATYKADYATFRALAAKASSLGGTFTYGSQPMALTAINASTNTPLGLQNVVQDWVHVVMTWSNAGADSQLKDIVHQMGNLIEQSARANDADLPFRFMNDAYDGQDVLGGYGGTNLEKLKGIAERYDSSGIMQRLQNGGWLLTRVAQKD